MTVRGGCVGDFCKCRQPHPGGGAIFVWIKERVQLCWAMLLGKVTSAPSGVSPDGERLPQ